MTKTKKLLASMLLSVSMAVSAFAVIPGAVENSAAEAAAGVVFQEDFEGYGLGEKVDAVTVTTDPNEPESGTQVGYIPSSGTWRNDFDESLTGEIEFNTRVRSNDKSNFLIRVRGENGDIAMLRLGCLTAGMTLSGFEVAQSHADNNERLWSALTTDSEAPQGDTTKISSGTVYGIKQGGLGNWEYVKIVVDTAAKTYDVYISGIEITQEMVESGEGVSCCKDIPFFNADSSSVISVAIEGQWIYQERDNVYFDDISVILGEGGTVTPEPSESASPEPSASADPDATPEPTATATPEPTPMDENIVFYDNFEEYEEGTTLDGSGKITADPNDSGSGNKTVLIESTGSWRTDFDREITGKAEINAKVRSADRSNFVIRVRGDNGDIALLRLGCLTTGTSLSGNPVDQNYTRMWAALTPESGGLPTDTNTINVDTVYSLHESGKGNWEYVKIVANMTTKTCDIYIAGTEITQDMIAGHMGLTSYYEGVPFYSNDATAVTGMSIEGQWIYQRNDNVYFDEVSAGFMQPPKYEVLSPVYTTHDGMIEVSAEVRKGEGDAKLITALYNDDGTLAQVKIDEINDDSPLQSGRYIHKAEFEDNGTETIKIMLWDDELTPYTAAAEPEYTEYSTPAPTPADDLWDVEIPEYEPADIERADVPQVVAEDEIQVIPEELEDRVYRTYPDGKLKSFLISIDDGPNLGDCQLVIPLLREYGLTAAFNVNPTADLSKGFLFNCTDGVGDWVQHLDSEAFKTKVLPLYEGFEIGNHGTDHNPTSLLSKDGVRQEIGLGKYNCEIVFGKEVGGYINSWREITPADEPASGEWTRAYTLYTGHRYVRNAPLKNVSWASRPSELNYQVPTDFMNWNPTVQDAIEIKDSDGNTYHTNDIMDYYAEADFGNTWTVYSIWGHSTDMSSVDYGNYTYSTNVYFGYFSDVCVTAAEYSDEIWNTTMLGYVDYVNASRLTEVSTDGDSITIYNPSKCIDVWMNVDGRDVMIPAGESVTI